MEDHAVAVLLEDLRSQFRVFGEALQGQRDALQRLDDKATAGFNAQDVRLQRLETGVSVLRTDVSDVKERLGHVEIRLEGVETRLESVETRLESVETGLESVETRLESVEIRLESVDTRLGRVEHHLELNGSAVSKTPTKRKPRR